MANWIDQAVSIINDASGRGDGACVKWLNKIIEQENTFLELKDVPREWWWLDRRRSEAMQVMVVIVAKQITNTQSHFRGNSIVIGASLANKVGLSEANNRCG